jgi:hypothetical protein
VIATFFGMAGHGSYPSFAGGARCCALSATDACGYTLSVMGYGALFGTQYRVVEQPATRDKRAPTEADAYWNMCPSLKSKGEQSRPSKLVTAVDIKKNPAGRKAAGLSHSWERGSCP